MRVSLLIAMTAVSPSLAGPVSSQVLDSLPAAIAHALVEENLVGATWALVYPDHTIIGSAGSRNISQATRMSPHDRVQVASVAKTLIATGVLQLVTAGRIDLDAPVGRYLDSVRFDNPWESTSPLRVRHLLDHSGGLDDARMWQVFSLRAHPDAPLRDGLALRGGAVRIRYRPGDRFSYSNSGFLLLGMIIEAVTRERYETWLDRELLVPLAMTRSTFGFVTQAGPRGDTTLAMGHFDPRTTSPAVPIHVRPASQFTTTASDMARFLRFLMSDGRVEGRVIVDSALLRGMGRPVTTEAARAGLPGGYASGLMRRDRHGVVGLCHFGNVGTFRAAICLYPDQQKGFFVSHNVDTEDGNFDRIDRMLIAALDLSSPGVQREKEAGVDPTEWEGMYIARPSRFEQFAYLDELGGAVRARWDGRRLNLLPFQGDARALTPVGGRLFRGDDRSQATHVLTHSTDGKPIIADGLRTLERINPLRLYALWGSAAAGILGLLYVLIVGGVRSVRALRKGKWRSELLGWPTLILVLLVIAPALYLTESFLAIGDPTPANLALALLTAGLPLSLLVAGIRYVRSRVASPTPRRDMLALVCALQWCLVLTAWGLMPLTMWR